MPFQRGDAYPVNVPFALAKTVVEDDLIGIDAAGAGFKASEQAFVTDLATTRAAFVLLFAGASNQFKDLGLPILNMSGPLADRLKINTAGVRTYACVAGTYKVGDRVGPAKQAGNALEDKIVELVASEAQSIGRVVGLYGVKTAGQLVEVNILSTVFPTAK